MGIGIQTRLLAWLLLLVLPIAAATTILVKRVDTRLTERVYAGLSNSHRLESARIEASLSQYVVHARSLAARQNLGLQLGRYYRVKHFKRSEARPVVSNSEISTVLNISQRLRKIARNLKAADSRSAEVKIVTYDGKFSGQSLGFTDNTGDFDLINRTRKVYEPAFSPAFQNESGEAMISIAVPVFNSANSTVILDTNGPRVIGFIIIQMKLGPIIDLVQAHKKLGETSESVLTQLTPEGDAQLITPLRFKENAAFNMVKAKELKTPLNQALETSGTQVVPYVDYRGVDTTVVSGRIDTPGWGLIIKIDSAEAFASLAEVKQLIMLATLTTVLFFLLSWWFMLRPLARRLCSVAIAADRVAAGDYSGVLKDPVSDEIGSLSNSLDTLARELDHDQKLRVEAERKLKYQAQHDSLTGLFNRKHMQDMIDELSQTQSGDEHHSILFLDLDGFKLINDQYGHHIGDDILVAIAGEISKILPDSSCIGRWGGDEFLIILPDTDEKQAGEIVARISDRFEHAFMTSSGEQSLGCSIGISTSDTTIPISSCVELADTRMYEVKQSRKSGNEDRATAGSFVRESLADNRSKVFYTPIIEATTAGNTRLVGAEAWLHLYDIDGNRVPHEQYLSVREEEISTMLDNEALLQVFSDLTQWRQGDLVSDDFCVSVNLNSASLQRHCLAGTIQEKLDEYDLPAQCIGLEISANSGITDLDVVQSLRSIGVRLLLDNLPLQNVSLLEIARISPDTAKFTGIGELFTSQPDKQSDTLKNKRLVFKHILQACLDLNIRCIAEGVETQEHMNESLLLGVNTFQGFASADHALSSNNFTITLTNMLSENGVNTHRNFRIAS